jgi:hypothetical protein
MYFASIQKENDKKIIKQWFMDYLIKKYPFLKVIVESKIDFISFAFKKQLLWALNHIYTEVEVYNTRKNNANKSRRILESD